MKKRICGGFCLLLFALYALQPALGQISGGEGLYGERIQLGSDSGEPIVPTAPARQQEEGKSIVPWVVAGATALGATALGAVLLVDKIDQESSEAQDAADAAAKAAEAAAAAAAASADAAAAAAAPPGGYKSWVNVVGTFSTQGASVGGQCPDFAPSITFTASPGPGQPGGVANFMSSADCDFSGQGGDYTQVSERSIYVNVNDGFYLGKWTTETAGRLRKVSSPNEGLVLSAEPGAKVEEFPIP
jgi:hypothetical protein